MGSAVVSMAEGAGQDLLQKNNATNASGNTILGNIGVYIQQEVSHNLFIVPKIIQMV
ncbi:hypothetical protein TanjilG_25000 [Lupinus angustifolius]|uniref:Uncharacterized protein n=1 Tax=Lupinus angustifolius TaxID=3871 RepID=A0A1J7HC89_LUPAN|nr:hypothetical protein TanjilG_25000 [Lupinus angustifolius]